MLKKFFFFLLVCAVFVSAQQKPKNIILLIGDGMGINTVSASIYADKNNPFRKFKSIGLSITTCLDRFITDSGAGATAISTGYRTNYTWLSLDPSNNKPLKTILEKSEELNKSTGVIATSSITNATPAAFLAHVNSRSLEFEIANQIADKDVEVLIGAGKSYFFSEKNGGTRNDSLGDLTPILKKNGYNVITDVNEILSYEKNEKVIALLDTFALPRAVDRKYSLKELVNKSIDILSKDKDGFFLIVEGSQIDWVLHDHLDSLVLSEMNDFTGAIDAALEFAEKDSNTLVIVTADHETGGMSINGGTVEGKDLKLKYTTNGHTAEMVGIFAKGPGEDEFQGIMENYMIGRKMFLLFDEKEKFIDNSK